MYGLALGRAGAEQPNSIQNAALGILRRYGTDAHVYLPGANGVAVSGLPTNNYTLSDGSTGYSAVDGTVGLVLDAAGSVGAERVTNGDFSAGSTGWTTIQIGWSISGGAASVNSAAAGSTFLRQGSTVANAWYMVTFDVPSFTSGSLYPIVGNALSTTPITSSGTGFVRFVKATDTTGFGVYAQSTTTVATVDNISVKQVTGIHATQSTTSNKCAVRRGLYNLLLNSATPATQSVTCAAAPYTLALYGTGSVTLSGTGSGTLNGTGVSDLVVLNFTPTAGSVTFTKSGTVSSFGLFTGALTAQQILAEGGIPLTTSTAASNPSAGRYWWGTDSGDSLALGSVPFQFTDDFFVCVGAACNNKAVYPGVFESLGGTARIYSYFDVANIAVTQFKDDAGTSTYIIGPAFSDGASVVLSSYKQSGQVCTGLNGTDGTPQAAPAGTFTLSSSKLLNGLDGKMAAGVIIKGQVSAADRLIIERWVASLTPAFSGAF